MRMYCVVACTDHRGRIRHAGEEYEWPDDKPVPVSKTLGPLMVPVELIGRGEDSIKKAQAAYMEQLEGKKLGRKPRKKDDGEGEEGPGGE